MNFNNKKSLKELRDAITEARVEQDRIYSAAERENRSLTKSEDQRLNELRREHDQAERAYNDAAAELESMSRENASLMGDIGNELRAAKIKRAANDFTLGKLARHMIRGGAMPESLEERAVTSSSGATTIQDPNTMNNILYSLQANNPLASAGTEFVLMENNTRYPKVTGYPSGQWLGAEGTAVTDASMTIGSVDWDFVDLAIRVNIQNQVLLDSSGRAERAVTEAIRRSISDSVLKAVLYGAAASDQPNGLDNISGVQTVDAGSNIISNYGYLLQAYRNLLDANANPENFSMIANPAVWQQIASLQDANGNPAIAPQGIRDMAMYWSTAAKTNYGAGEDETVIYMGDFSQLVVGFQGAFEFKLTELYAEKLQTGFMAWMRCDIQALHPDNFCLIQNLNAGVPVFGN